MPKIPTYYPIDKTAARRAKEMNSHFNYEPGSATAAYRQKVDKAAAIAEAQKARVDPMYHEKIDRLLDTYARKLAENINQGYAIDARCPSILTAGSSNFPVRKKEKTVPPTPIWRSGNTSKGSWIKSGAPGWAASAATTAAPCRSSAKSSPSVNANKRR